MKFERVRQFISLGLLAIVIASWSSFAGAAGSSGITYHGRILKPDGAPLEGTSVQFKIQIRSPGNENCLLYEETQTRNMQGSSGVFSLTLNDGTGTRTDTGSQTFDTIFANRGTFALPAGACASGLSYTPNFADGRAMAVFFRSETMANWESMPIQSVNFSPMAIQSKYVGGFSAQHLLRFDDTAAALNTNPLNSSQFNALTALIDGTSTQYVKASAATGATMPTYNGSPTTLTPGAIWFDTGTNELKYYNGTGVTVVGSGGGGSGTVTGITIGTGLVDGTGATGTVITTAGTIALPNVGTAGSYYKVTTDAQGRVSSGVAALVEADIPSLTTAGKVSGSAITSGTIGGTTAISTSGNLQTSNDVTAKRIFVQDSGSNYAGLKAPATVPTTYSLTLPTGLPGSSGMVLSSDTSGNLSWVTPSAGSVTSVGVTAPLTSGGTASAPIIGITQSTTTTDGYLSSTDWNTFNNKLSGTLASGKIYVGNGSNVATAVTPSGDVTVTTAGGFTVTQIQGVAVSATLPTTAGQVLRYDGTGSYVPAQLSTSDISGLATALSNKIDSSQMPANCAANQTLTFSSPTGAWTCSSIAITGSAFGSQTQNLVLASPDGSAGNPTFRALSANDIPSLSAAKITSGTLAVAQGGTGTATGSITGTGALTFAAGGSNQNVTLTPSGTGNTILNGNVGVGTTTPGVSLDLGARTDAIALPKGTTAEQPASPAAGMFRYNTSNSLLEFYNGSAWTSLAAAGSGISSLTGDVTATGPGAAAATVVKVNGVSYPASPATNTVPVVTGANTITYQTLPVAAGGTGLTSVATNSLIYGNGTGNLNTLAPVNSAVLTSTAGGVPQWSTISSDTFTQYALLAGRAGGQTLNGGTAASENLALDSTANATKGNILLAPSGGNVGIGTTTPANSLDIVKSQAAQTLMSIQNANAGSGAMAGVSVQSDAGWLTMYKKSSNYGGYGSIETDNHDIGFSTNGSFRMVIGSSGGVAIGAYTPAAVTPPADGLTVGGNVGVGTTVPSARLEVASGTANVSGLKFTNFTSTAPTSTGQPVGVDASGNLVTISVSGSGTVSSGTANQMAFYNATGSAVSGNANATISNGVLSLGQSGSVIGGLNLSGNTSGTVSINPQAAAGTYNFNLPITAGTSGQILTSGGGAAAPMTWTTLAASATTDATNASNISSGTLNAARLPTVPVAAGGTGLTSLATNSLLYGNGTGNMNALAPVNSAVLTSTAGGVPQWSTIASDTFTQYALLAGRAGGQTLNGGTAANDNLTLDSTANASKGNILLAPSGGNVGIGTTSPNGLLSVEGVNTSTFKRTDDDNLARDGIQIYRGRSSATAPLTGFGANLSFVVEGATNDSYAASGRISSIWENAQTNDTTDRDSAMLFYTAQDNTLAEKMRVTSAGNVGIGTNSPGSRLETWAINSVDSTGQEDVIKVTAGNIGGGANIGGRFGIRLGNNAFLDKAVGIYATSEATYMSQLGLSFYTGSGGGTIYNEKMRITGTGKVGIGTTTPAVSLDISVKTDALALPKGTTAQQPGSPVAGWIRYNTDNNAVEFHNGTAWTTLSTGGGSYLSSSGGTLSGSLTISSGGASITGGVNNNSGGITNAGSITGVGANITGSGAMTVAAGGTAQNLTLSSSTTGSVNVGSGNGTSLQVQDGGASTVNYLTAKGAVTGSAPTLGAGGADTNIDIKITPKGTGNTLITSGNVGIGTTSPGTFLMQVSPSGSSGNQVQISTTAATGYGANLKLNTGSMASGRTFSLVSSGTSDSAGAGKFLIWDNTSSQPRMAIDSAGYVGIGTTAPSARLDVVGTQLIRNYGLHGYLGLSRYNGSTGSPTVILNGETVGQIGFSAYDGSAAVIGANIAAIVNGTVASNSVPTDLIFATGVTGGGGERMRILSGGNVGIGTTSPSATLEVVSSSAPVLKGTRTSTGTNYTATSAIFKHSTTGVISDGFGPQIKFAVEGNGLSETELGSILFARHGNNTSAKFAVNTVSSGSWTESMTILPSGNVGIGTTSPNGFVDIRGSLHVDQSGAGTLSNNQGAWTRWVAGAGNGYTHFVNHRGAGNGGFVFSDTSDGLTINDLVKITGSGNVGIGTTSPSANLHLVSSAAKLRIDTDQAAPSSITQTIAGLELNAGAMSVGRYTPAIKFTSTDPEFTTTSPKFLAGITGVSTETYTLDTNSGMGISFLTTSNGAGAAPVPSERMRIDHNGNVGIGTTAPGSRLDIVGPTSGGTILLSNDTVDSATKQSSIASRHYLSAEEPVAILTALSDSSTNTVRLGGGNSTMNAASVLTFFTATDQTTTTGLERMRINSAGNVGIGTTGPTEKLHVVGNLRVQGSTDCTLGNGSGGTNCSSDIRLKTNVQEIENPLQKILSLRGVEFDWNEKSQSPGNHAIGVIAQDVEKQFPTAVIEDSNTGYKKVDYAVLVAPVIQAFKELNKRITELFTASETHSREIASVKAENAQLKAKNKELELKLKQQEAETKARFEKIEKLLKSK